jgi:hypothetical protein
MHAQHFCEKFTDFFRIGIVRLTTILKTVIKIVLTLLKIYVCA